jgi:hypothetical protein
MMKKQLFSLFFTILFSFLMIGDSVNAKTLEPLDKQGVQQLFLDAYNSQFSLTERHHTFKEIKDKLYQYMSKDFVKAFLKEHITYEKEGYILYGLDFSIYLMPKFTFNDQTHILYNNEKNVYYVYEKHSGEEGPVLYNEQYDLVTLGVQNNRWVIKEISYLKELPSDVVKNTVKEKVIFAGKQEKNKHRKFENKAWFTHTDNQLMKVMTSKNDENLPTKQAATRLKELIGFNIDNHYEKNTFKHKDTYHTFMLLSTVLY